MKRKMTRFIAMAMAAFMLAGCGAASGSDSQNQNTSVAAENTDNVDSAVKMQRILLKQLLLK